MKTPSTESARALTQAVLLACLCDRYHDLASYASEPLKQRIHFLAKSDGSNLKELFIWDLPSATSSATEASPEFVPDWKPTQIEEYIHQQWSADQLPLNPPNNAKSWESTIVYCKTLDVETVQAIVPIGLLDASAADRHAVPTVIAVVLLLEDGPCWKYHNMAILKEATLQTDGWNILTDQPLQTIKCKEYDSKRKSKLVGGDIEIVGGENADTDDDDDDDDYWGQYGDEEDESPSDENSSQSQAPKVSHDTTSDATHEDDEDYYWKSYAEQQEKQEESERKRAIQQQQQGQQLQQQDIQPQDNDLQKILASLSSVDSSTGLSAPTNPPGQVDQIMLSSLLQMLATDDVAQSSTYSHEISDDQANGTRSRIETAAEKGDDKFQSFDLNETIVKTPTSRDNSVVDSMRSVVLQATRAGYSKDEVFEMLGSIYENLE
ncbi:hypothetical protein BGX27_010269 [Mortierella sp. AM989]|nr:hypothetical protein BGX27_010269 [Mortierella sp. AM989]